MTVSGFRHIPCGAPVNASEKLAVEKLKSQLRVLNNKIEEAKRKRNILIARQKRAEAQKAIQNTMAGLSDTSAFDTFDRMAEKIEAIEAEAEANQELAGELQGDSLTQRFKALESKKAPADLALMELKQKMGLLPAAAGTEPKALPGAAAASPASGQAARDKKAPGTEPKPADKPEPKIEEKSDAPSEPLSDAKG